MASFRVSQNTKNGLTIVFCESKVRVDYARSIVYIWDVYTHSAYDRLDLKALDEKIRRERKKFQTKHPR
jgi:hypothetical protein